MFKKILVAFDIAHNEQVPYLLKAAFEVLDQEGGQICLFYADPNLEQGISTQQLEEQNIRHHKEEVKFAIASLMASIQNTFSEKEVSAIKCHTQQGSVHEQILKQAKALDVDAIILMSKKPGFSSYFIGSNADRVVRHAKCSVFVIRH
ncbi:hypothetical protein TW85_09655 [Marinomonas sp. S3726]|uniref:universal stress protein n=1 Tax=Marinomonas sp. S3726 TaxID=579484 RepID=UPI0005F9EF96|nr:universal stress protein [Marinomonas sp. S3726]KJZ14185.1 hypothetical protein TW85_09655 [Marinomonas sp. S3726]